MGIMFLSVFTVFLPVETCDAAGDTLHVGSGQTYSTIQAAINGANESDTVYVHSGTYNENIVINKTITLTGEGSEITSIQGSGDYSITVTASNVVISGFTIKSDGGSFACVYLNSVTNCEISNNIIKNGGNCVHLVGSNSNIIKDNTIEDNNVGVYLSNSDSNTIRDNYIQNNNAYGVSLSSSSNDNDIYLNHLSDNMLSNARDLSSNSWDYNNQGNYWDDYNDYDDNDDDIGDSPYVIDGNSQDDYPLGIFLNQEPVASIISITPNPSTEGQTVSFNGHGTDDGSIINWEWRSNLDGKFASQEDPSYSGLSVGIHTISFRVQDDASSWSAFAYADSTLVIEAQSNQNQKPTATIVTISPTAATYGESIYFHGLGQDTDGTVETFSWRSSKDGVISSESTFSKSDLSVGTHTIYFKVQDNDGEWSSEQSASIEIIEDSSPGNQPPVADAGGPYTGYTNVSITFDASGSYDSDIDDSISSYEWTFGDGCNGNGESHGHTYTSEGNFIVTLTVTDSHGSQTSETTYAYITVATGGGNGNDGNTSSSDEENGKNDEDEEGLPWFIIIIAVMVGMVLLIVILFKAWYL